MKNVSVKNIGSYNLTSFYISMNTEDLETSNPIGSGTAGKYAAGSFIMFRNESSDLDYFHAGRMEWNLSEVLDQEVFALSTPPGDIMNFSHGWYRRADGNEFLWLLENGTQTTGPEGAWCNTSSTSFIIKRDPENSSSYARDLTDNVATAATAAQNANWTYFHFTAVEGGPLQGHCVAAYYDCTRILIYKHDRTGLTNDGFGDCGDAQYLATETLMPGEKLDKFKIKTSIPYGVPAGDTMETVMTFFTSVA